MMCRPEYPRRNEENRQQISASSHENEFQKLHYNLNLPKTIKWRNSEMELKRGGSQPSAKGPAEYFTGIVRIDPLFQAPDPARVLGVSVTFEPGARTAWHTIRSGKP
jgi:hypothetical protein